MGSFRKRLARLDKHGPSLVISFRFTEGREGDASTRVRTHLSWCAPPSQISLPCISEPINPIRSRSCIGMSASVDCSDISVADLSITLWIVPTYIDIQSEPDPPTQFFGTQYQSLTQRGCLCSRLPKLPWAPPPMISIVDDDESVRESTKALVRSLGYAACTFPSVEEFLRSNLDETTCLILDVRMKGLSGIELQERLIAEGRQTPIIFVTAVLDEQIRDQVLEAGAIDILSKPFSDERLASCLVSALNGQ